jgi:hypothetical protein
MNDTTTKGKPMKSEITLSTEMLVRFIADEEKDKADYEARGNREMAFFAIGRIAVWQSLLDVYAKA